MDNLKFTIAKNLSELRRKNKYTQIELAEKLNYSDKAISKWEQGESTPSIEVLYKLSQLYNVSIDYIVGDAKAPKERVKTTKTRKTQRSITLLSLVGVWLLALIFYTVFDICVGIKLWILFCWAVPVASIILIVFDSVWNKSRKIFYYISLLVWSILICLSLQFWGYNIWQILFIGIPLQVAILICAKMIK